MIQDYDKQKPEKRLWPFSTVLIFASSTLFMELYYLTVTSDSLLIPLILIGFSVPFMVLLGIFLGSFFQNDSWRLRDIYKLRSFMSGGFLKFALVFGIILYLIIGGINIPEPDFYGKNESNLFSKSKLDFKSAQAVHRSYMILFYVAYFYFVHYVVLDQITKKAKELTYSSISIRNKPSEYWEKGYWTDYKRFYGEKYINLNGELIKSKELEDWLTEISTDSYKWPNNDFIPETQFTTRKIFVPKDTLDT